MDNEPVLKPSGISYDPLTQKYVVKPKKSIKVDLPSVIEPITLEKWDSMDPKARWDSIVALRGPDLRNSDALKFMTSSVIRWRLSKVMRVGGLVNPHLPFVITSGGFDKSNFSLTHFIGHIYEAANWLRIPSVNIPGPIMEKIMSGGFGRIEAVGVVYPYLADVQKQAVKNLYSNSGYDLSYLKDLPAKKEEAPDAEGGL